MLRQCGGVAVIQQQTEQWRVGDDLDESGKSQKKKVVCFEDRGKIAILAA
jgi:hypothetical protein